MIKSDGTFDLHVIYEYSKDLAHQTSIISVDENGNLKNDQRLRGAARVIFNIDEEGVRTPEFFYADGSPLSESVETDGEG